jgi:cellular nucleic acid-binding protein
LAKVGPYEHGRETSFAPAQVARGSGGLIGITIMCGDAIADKAFKIVFGWMLDTCKSGETEKISDQLTFTDLAHCMMVNELLAVPVVLKDQVARLLAKIADNQVPLEDVKALYARTAIDHPARSMVVESIGKAYLEQRLRDGGAYYNYYHENEEFKKDLEQHIHKQKVCGNAKVFEPSAFTEDQARTGVKSDNTDWPTADGDLTVEGSDTDRGPSTAMAGNRVKSCGNEALKHSDPTYVMTRILSFDGPADEWSTPATTSGNEWSQGASEWQDTAVSAGGCEDGWGNAAGGSSTNNDSGWGDDVGGAGDTAGGDDDTCRRCKQSGHFARECPEPRDDSCFNCGQRGHMARDCTEPKKPRGGDRACRKCNEVGHIARDCPNGVEGGDRACHKCGETGHIMRECTSSGFGAAAGGGGGGGMQCYNCHQFGHKSSECTNEPVERQYGSDPRTCNKCGQKGHISRDCREDVGDTYAMQHGGDDHGEQYDARYGSGSYNGQEGLYDPDAGIEESIEPVREETINVTVSATRVRKGKRGRLGYVDITQQMYDPRAFDKPRYDSYSRGGQRREGGGGRGGRGSRGSRGGRGGGQGGHRNGGDEGHGGDFADENVPPSAPADVPAVVEGDWADAGDSSAPALAGW